MARDNSKEGPVPSSASTGTFMIEPRLENQYYADSSIGRVLKLFLPSKVIEATAKDLSRFGEKVISKKVLDWVSDAERNVPYVKGSGRNAIGQRTDELVTTEGWRMLQKLGLKEGIVAIAYENEYLEYSRLVQFIKYHIWTGSCAYVTCPSAMQDGAASLLRRHISSPSLDSWTRSVVKSAYERLTARDENPWTSGQWMTERSGGSDVSGTETLATYSPSPTPQTQLDGLPLGPWVIDGFKWFSSATDSQMSIALAQTSKGLSAFYIPVRRTKDGGSELNGISISRLKNKLGTKALPTAELELRGARAYLLGDEGNGIREISTILNITRVHNAVTSLGLFGRGLAIAKAFTSVREMAGKGNKKTLKDIPLHIRTLADITLSYRANMLFTYFTVYLLGISDQQSLEPSGRSIASDRLRPSTPEDLQLILRILTPAVKALTAKASISGLQECMESLGGIGYLENEESQQINIARLYRDVNVLSIWEGTTNVLGTDFVRILKGWNGLKTIEALELWTAHAISSSGDEFKLEKQGIVNMLQSFRFKVTRMEIDELMIDARELMEAFATIITGTLLIVDAESDHNGVSGELCHRFSREYGLVDSAKSDWKNRVAWDSRIVSGEEAPSPRL